MALEFVPRHRISRIQDHSRLALLCPPLATSTHAVVFYKVARENNLIPSYISIKDFSPLTSLKGACRLLINSFKVLALLWSKNYASLSYRQCVIGKSILDETISQSRYGYVGILEIFLLARKTLYAFCLVDHVNILLRQRKVGLILGGDESYVYFSILGQLASSHDVPCFFVKGSDKVQLYKFNQSTLSAMLEISRHEFKAVALTYNMLSNSSQHLVSRCSGDRTSDKMPSVGPGNIESLEANCLSLNQFANSHWIYLHDLFDAVSIYGTNVFDSHVKWLAFTVNRLFNNKQRVVLKLHPNSRPKSQRGTKKAIKILTNRYPNLAICSNDISINSVNTLNPLSVITVYGSVVPEALYAGIPCLTAGCNHPYRYFKGLLTASTAQAYALHLDNLSVSSSQSLQCSASHSRESVVEDFARLRYLQSQFNSVPIPFDDMNDEQYQLFFHDLPYPVHNYERREKYLTNYPIFLRLLNETKHLNLSSILGIT